ncbi:MAG: family 43 glycosylhydrolase, partial [Eubacteriales bacterium]
MNTYCNPLSVPDVPSGRWLDTEQTRTNAADYTDYRSVSDPSVIYHDGKWIMYPSYSVAYVSEDFIHWKHVDIGVPHMRYSPAIVCFRGKWYLSGHSMSELYSSDSPLGPFTLCGQITDCHGQITAPADQCFLADGDRLYMYWIGCEPPADGEDTEYVTGTVGVEMNPDKPWEMLHEPVRINRFDPDSKWQRMGEDHQNTRMGWIEGQWMKKIGNRYYLMHSGSGTEYSTYANGIAYSDEGPLHGFHPQKNHNPLTYKKHGLLRGAGHGCITDGPGGTLWVFYTSVFCYNHMYERRIGMDPLGIDENGELYCPAVTDTPQYAPGFLAHPELGNGAGWDPLTFMQRPAASSHAPGRDPLYASDDSVLTWWQPEEDDAAPMIVFRLGDATCYRVQAIRLIWRDIGMEVLRGILPGPFRYIIEYAPDASLTVWEMLIDASDSTE